MAHPNKEGRGRNKGHTKTLPSERAYHPDERPQNCFGESTQLGLHTLSRITGLAESGRSA